MCVTEALGQMEKFFSTIFFPLAWRHLNIFLESFITSPKQYHVYVDNSTTPIIYSQPSLLCEFHLRHRLQTIFFIFTFDFFSVFCSFRTIWHLLIAMQRSISFHSSCPLKHILRVCVCAFFFFLHLICNLEGHLNVSLQFIPFILIL